MGKGDLHHPVPLHLAGGRDPWDIGNGIAVNLKRRDGFIVMVKNKDAEKIRKLEVVVSGILDLLRRSLGDNLAAVLTLLQTEGEELPDDRLIGAPLQYLPGKEENYGHRKHICKHAKRQRLVPYYAAGNAEGHASAQLYERHH